MEIDSGGGGGGAKRQRVDEQGDRCEAVDAGAVPVDRISVLPDELQLRILTHLSLKYAIRTGAVARGWRDLWKRRWEHRAVVEVYVGFRHDVRRELDALEREPRPRRRLDRFSFVVDICKLKSSELRRFTEYAAECRVEDLHVETRNRTLERKLNFHLPLCSPLLARLSLRRIGISTMYYKGAQPFRALVVIRLHSISIGHASFTKMMALCPNLITLDLLHCECGNFFYSVAMPQNLRNLTVAYCNGIASVNFELGPSLRSFRYSGDFGKAPFSSLPLDTVLSDLYIWFTLSVSEQCIIEKFHNSLPKDLSGLNVLTINYKALPVASSMPNLNLHSLRELQLCMFKMEAANIADIYVFLKTCQCPNLERLFVQFPSFVYGKPMEGSTDEVTEEPPEDGLDNLLMVKFRNFNWLRAEVQLVSFLLRKANSLDKLLIVSPRVTPLDLPDVQEANLLLVKEALANGKIMLSKSDDAATQPYHSERPS
ncbi:uncharacterized protein LOC120668517 [Panicum virgatum]|uniref:F-box domain-containing protein n=1 Tax=Panicum virgatum TaxID=38727 RepID=A0A8T0TGB3_PANVG|nr:uncharacterized protein LOC120668517 [Panicum virgatum]KAG2608054.1 hypothetical protein PVAP13_4NG288700 [Panicum virgatum]